MPKKDPLATQARRALQRGEDALAHTLLAQLIGEVVGTAARTVTINADQYSLNSLNGTTELVDGRHYFFKYHQEEGEESTIEEYYNAQLLREHGFTVDVPVFACGEPGRQILLYDLRSDTRLADVCRSIELGESTWRADAVVASQRAADQHNLERMLASLTDDATAAESAAEPIHQLFALRMRGGASVDGFQGRVAAFYAGKSFDLAGTVVPWEDIRAARWRINGVLYEKSLGELFRDANDVLDPARLAGGIVTAHGDAHNANVWYERTPSGVYRQVLFDPAFAGPHIPALLAEVKATFHNIFAHPAWLYEPAEVPERYEVSARFPDGVIEITHNWAMTGLRAAFWQSKTELLWAPLLQALAASGRLDASWRQIIRLALFCCPTLVMDLRAGGTGGHNPFSSALGLAIAVMVGSEPREGADAVSTWLDATTTTLEPLPSPPAPPSAIR